MSVCVISYRVGILHSRPEESRKRGGADGQTKKKTNKKTNTYIQNRPWGGFNENSNM